ncbi:unnamed protein product, partial [marine sediment metagenome]
LDEKAKEIATLSERHRKELESVSADYQAEIDALQGNSGIREEYEALKIKHADLTKSLDDISAAHASEIESFTAKHAELSKSHTDATGNHAKQLEKLKQDHAAVIVTLDNKEREHQKLVDELKSSHAKNLDDAHDRAITAEHASHAAELDQIQASHNEALAAVKQQVTEIHAAELKRLQASHEKAIAELSQQHSASQEAATSSAKALKVSALNIPLPPRTY